jgi:hypothetical protein
VADSDRNNSSRSERELTNTRDTKRFPTPKLEKKEQKYITNALFIIGGYAAVLQIIELFTHSWAPTSLASILATALVVISAVAYNRWNRHKIEISRWTLAACLLTSALIGSGAVFAVTNFAAGSPIAAPRATPTSSVHASSSHSITPSPQPTTASKKQPAKRHHSSGNSLGDSVANAGVWFLGHFVK